MTTPMPVAPRVDVDQYRRRGRRGAAMAVVLLAVGVGGLAAVVAGIWRYANADHLGILDDPVVVERAASACTALAAAVAAVPADAAPADVVRAQDRAIGDLIASMEALGHDRLAGDHPALYWVEDWQTLLTLREQYAAELDAGGTPALVVPTQDDIPITERMGWQGEDCVVAAQLAQPPGR